ncbi:multidrug effflux MFS transporter [Acuticoccus sp. MNP-M23]|uniref:multidrug effflux MFS transporter n=1 Tax=Acuticoccus sp. MNP-M23 TaxID=3072793 RepID=UPI002816711D|nr:multidrug effflux MFS transporter [Acuticoccus sp. MNP-M23]WMS42253.1 multidrug effflux MFS transporter [Acuticoccus sp. MNP-M23]
MRCEPLPPDPAAPASGHATPATSPAAAGPAMPSPSDAPVLLLILVSTIQPMALNMYVPAMAAMQGDLATTASLIQATLSAFLAATAFAQLVVGPLSDIYGRRPVLIGGALVFTLGTIVCIAAPNVEVLIAGRIIQGAGGCAGLALSRAIIRDIHGTRTSASMIGYVTMGMAIAPLITPAIGGFLYQISSWRVIFVVMGIAGLISLFATVTRLRETHPPGPHGNGVFANWRREVAELLTIRDFWLVSATLAALSLAFFSFIAGGAFVASSVFGLDAQTYGLYFIFVVTGYVVGNFFTGRYSARIGVVRMIRIGNAISLIGIGVAVSLAVAGVASPLALFAPMLIVGTGNGFALPNCIAGCVSVRPDLAGTAAGVAGFFQIGSGAIASVGIGLVIEFEVFPASSWPVLAPMACGGILAFILAFMLSARRFS